MRLMLALIATSTLAAAPAMAGDEPGWFVGAGAGYFTVDANGFDGSDTSFKVLGGYDFGRYFTGEIEYIDGGSPDDRGVSIEVDGFNASVLGTLPVSNQVEVFAKLGMFFWDVEARGFGDDSGEDFSYGLGISYGFPSNLGVRAEYQRFDIEDSDTVDLAALSLTWRF